MNTAIIALSVFAIGNSLTHDSRADRLTPDSDHHIAWAKAPGYILDHPEDYAAGSTSWLDALTGRSWDVLVVQPHRGSTLADDLRAIEAWAALQPGAKLVIHPGWPTRDAVIETWEDLSSVPHSPEYLSLLADEVFRATGRRATVTPASLAWVRVARDVEQGAGYYDSIEALYRDRVHASWPSGSYLAHNSLRHAIGMPLSNDLFGLSEPEAAYLNSVIVSGPLASVAVAIIMIAGCLSLGRRKNNRQS